MALVDLSFDGCTTAVLYVAQRWRLLGMSFARSVSFHECPPGTYHTTGNNRRRPMARIALRAREDSQRRRIHQGRTSVQPLTSSCRAAHVTFLIVQRAIAQYRTLI